jgi:hypothetical protein
MYVQRCRKSEFEVKETNKIKSVIEGAYVLVKRYLKFHRLGGCWCWWLKAEGAMQSFLSYSALPSSLLGFFLHERNFPKFGSLEFKVREMLEKKKKKCTRSKKKGTKRLHSN